MTGEGGRLDLATAQGLARSLAALVDDARHRIVAEDPSELAARVTGHLGCGVADIPNVRTSFDSWDHVNLHRGVQAYLDQHSPAADWFGVQGQMHGMQDVMDVLALAGRSGMFRVGAVDYATKATGPDDAVDVVQFGLVCSWSPAGEPVVLSVRGPIEHGSDSSCLLRVLAADRSTATEVRAKVEQQVGEHNVYAGQLLQLDVTETRGNELVSFLRRPHLQARDVVLAPGVLEAIEGHVVGAGERNAQLRAHGQHLKRGVLLYGPPGSGKTHTVRYLMSRLSETTVVVLSGRALTKLLPAGVSLARRLQPSVVVIEDVDLIAEDRSYTQGTAPVLFELLNRIDGVDPDADITFVLTTNRVDIVEPALVERPGRVDLAVQIPRPDAEARERLLRLYAEDTDLDLPDASPLVAGTEGVTASFIRELVRRAVLDQLDQLDQTSGATRAHLDQNSLQQTLDDLLAEHNALTRSILGGRAAPPE